MPTADLVAIWITSQDRDRLADLKHELNVTTGRRNATFSEVVRMLLDQRQVSAP
jgi:hypothetical protein